MTLEMQSRLTAEIEIVEDKIATQHFVIKSSSNDEVAVGKAAARLRELHAILAELHASLSGAAPLTPDRL